MGHYAGEMGGEGISLEDSLRIIKEKSQGLTSTWKTGLRMAAAYPFDNPKLTCPQCYAEVGRLFLDAHDKWHKDQKAAHFIGPGLF